MSSFARPAWREIFTLQFAYMEGKRRMREFSIPVANPFCFPYFCSCQAFIHSVCGISCQRHNEIICIFAHNFRTTVSNFKEPVGLRCRGEYGVQGELTGVMLGSSKAKLCLHPCPGPCKSSQGPPPCVEHSWGVELGVPKLPWWKTPSSHSAPCCKGDALPGRGQTMHGDSPCWWTPTGLGTRLSAAMAQGGLLSRG